MCSSDLPELVPADVVTGGRRRVLLTWEIPLEVDGRRTQLRGVTSWVPSAASAEWGGAGRRLGAFGVPIAALGASDGRRRGGADRGRPPQSPVIAPTASRLAFEWF